MTNEERPLYEIVEKLEAGVEQLDSVPGPRCSPRCRLHSHSGWSLPRAAKASSTGTALIFDTIYKGSRNELCTLRSVRFAADQMWPLFSFSET